MLMVVDVITICSVAFCSEHAFLSWQGQERVLVRVMYAEALDCLGFEHAHRHALRRRLNWLADWFMMSSHADCLIDSLVVHY